MSRTREDRSIEFSREKEELASKFVKRSTQVASLEGPDFSRVLNTSLYAQVVQEFKRIGVPKRHIRGGDELFPRVRYNVSFFEISSPVLGDECVSFLWNEESIFPGWNGLLALQYAVGNIFPTDAWVVAPQPSIFPLVGEDGTHRMFALKRSKDGKCCLWVMKRDTGWLHPSMCVLHVVRHNERR